MKIAVIGAGVTGLVCGYLLLKKGHVVHIYEKDSVAGGLASSFELDKNSWPLERFYHHIFYFDESFKRMLKCLGLYGDLFYTSPVSSILYKNHKYQFDTPLSILRFPHLSLMDKFKLGAGIFRLRTTRNWKRYEDKKAVEYIPQIMGSASYEILWEPLLRAKFSSLYKERGLECEV